MKQNSQLKGPEPCRVAVDMFWCYSLAIGVHRRVSEQVDPLDTETLYRSSEVPDPGLLRMVSAVASDRTASSVRNVGIHALKTSFLLLFRCLEDI